MYIFYVHSHITYVVSQLIVNEYNIAHENIRYITARNYKINQNSIKTCDITPFFDYLETTSKIKKVFRIKTKIKSLDVEINKLSNNTPFCIFLPQFNHSLFQILGSHKMCKDLVLIEEGITAYKKDQNFYKQPRQLLFHLLFSTFTDRFLLKNSHYTPYPKEKFKKAICIDKSCFPYIEDKKVLQIKENTFSNYKNTIVPDSLVFVMDSFKEQTNITEKEYFAIIKQTINLAKKYKHKPLYIKFHPAQENYIRNETLNYIEENFEFEHIICLEDSCLLEFEFINSSNLIVIGMHTSLLHYAKRFGHHVLSSIRTTSKIPSINKYINHIMDEIQIKEYLSYE